MTITNKQLEIFTTVVNQSHCWHCEEELYLDHETANREFVVTIHHAFHIACYFDHTNDQ